MNSYTFDLQNMKNYLFIIFNKLPWSWLRDIIQNGFFWSSRQVATYQSNTLDKGFTPPHCPFHC